MVENGFFIKPVAKIKNGYNEKFGIPRQSGLAPNVMSEIIFNKEFSDENMIRDIEQYSHLWLVFGFSQNEGEWSQTVRPPKLGGNKRVGVFATRSPFRPNSLGLSVVKLVEVKDTPDGKALVVSGADLLNGTPIFDIKPYLPYVDSIPEALGGFSEIHKEDAFEVVVLDGVRDTVSSQELEEIKEILSLDPRPQYQNDENRIYGISYKDYEIKFRFINEKIEIVSIGDKID